jgi:hypothetical protein
VLDLWNAPQSVTGDVVHVKVLGQPVIFLNTEETATDMLEKRSSIHSDRVKTVMINEL